MKLLGMLDSPYVRRTAISLAFLDVTFEHQAISVFTDFTEFQQLNPVVKAPTLVCANGGVLMDSSLIIQYVETSYGLEKKLWAQDKSLYQRQMRAVSLALAGCDKGVQWVYEKNLRPSAAQYQPWLERVESQINAAFTSLEQLLAQFPEAVEEPASQASISSAIAWQFAQLLLQPLLESKHFPHLQAHSARMEATAEFRKYPPSGPGVPTT